MTAYDAVTHDQGLAAERTALAWTRTGLAMCVLAVLLLRHGGSGAPAIMAKASGGLLLVFGILGATMRRHGHVGAGASRNRLQLRLVSAITALAAATAAVAVIARL